MESIFEILKLLDDTIYNHYILSLLIFIFLLYIYASISLPGTIILWVFSGYVFGYFVGYLLSIIFTTLGSFNLYYVSKNYLNRYFKNKFFKYLNKIDNLINDNSYDILIIFRMIPYVPFFIQNISLSFLNISNLKFIIVTFIGLTPIILFATIIGDTITDFNYIKEFQLENLYNKKFIILSIFIILIPIIRIYYFSKKKLSKK